MVGNREANSLKFAELAVVGPVAVAARKSDNAAPLRAGLKDAAGLSDHVVQLLAEPDRETARLFTVDILARSGGVNGQRRVPAVAGGDEHRIDVALQFVEVAIELAVLVAVVLVDELFARVSTAGLNVADGHALAIVEF